MSTSPMELSTHQRLTMSVRVDMSSLELNREHVNTQEIGVKNHQFVYVREIIISQCNGMI